MVRTKLSTLSLALVMNSLLFSLAAVSEQDDWVYTGLRMDRLFEKLGEQAPVRKIVSIQGAGYEGISVAVLPTVALAHEHFGLAYRVIQIAPTGPSEPIGDEALLFSSGGTPGNMFVRVRNIVFHFNGASRQAATDRAKKIVGVIESCPEAAPKGRFNPAPRIVSIGLPPRIAGGATIVVKPVVEGLGNPEHVMLWADQCAVSGPANGNGLCALIPQHNMDGLYKAQLELSFMVSGTGGRMCVHMIAVSPENVLVSKEEEVEFSGTNGSTPAEPQ